MVEKFIGDAVMAVFGLRQLLRGRRPPGDPRGPGDAWPTLDELNVEIAHAGTASRSHMRVGIDTGEVVVSTLGDRAGQEFVAVGQTVNRASRLQAAAPLGRRC